MQAKKWGISELAQYSGVKYDTVYSIVKARRKNTTLQILTSIATALGISMDHLLSEQEGTGGVPKLPAAIQQLADIAGSLSEVRQEELIRIAIALQKLEQEPQAFSESQVTALLQLRDQMIEQGAKPETLRLFETLIPPPRRLSQKRPHKPRQQQR